MINEEYLRVLREFGASKEETQRLVEYIRKYDLERLTRDIVEVSKASVIADDEAVVKKGAKNVGTFFHWRLAKTSDSFMLDLYKLTPLEAEDCLELAIEQKRSADVVIESVNKPIVSLSLNVERKNRERVDELLELLENLLAEFVEVLSEE